MIWFLVLNIPWLITVLYASFRFPDRLIRFTFLFLAVSLVGYANSVLVLKVMPDLDLETLGIASRSVFFWGCMCLFGYVTFLLGFSRREWLRSPLLLIPLSWVVLLGVLTLATDLVTGGVVREPTGLKPTFGPLRTPYIITFGVLGLAATGHFIFEMLRTRWELIRYQMQVTIASFSVGWAGILATNLVYPALTGDHSLSIAAPLWVILPVLGLGWLLSNARSHVLARQIRTDQYHPALELLRAARDLWSRKAGEHVILHNDGNLFLRYGERTGPAEFLHEGSLPMHIARGVLHRMRTLERENYMLALGVEAFQRAGAAEMVPKTGAIATEVLERSLLPGPVAPESVATLNDLTLILDEARRTNKGLPAQRATAIVGPERLNRLLKVGFLEESASGTLVPTARGLLHHATAVLPNGPFDEEAGRALAGEMWLRLQEAGFVESLPSGRWRVSDTGRLERRLYGTGFVLEAPQAPLGPLEAGEMRIILDHLVDNSFNLSRTHRALGITVNTLKAKMKAYGLRRLGESD